MHGSREGGQESGPPSSLKHWHLLLSHSKSIKIGIGTISYENKIIFRIPSPGEHFSISTRDVTTRLRNVREYKVNDPGEILYGSRFWIDLGHGYVSSEKQVFKTPAGFIIMEQRTMQIKYITRVSYYVIFFLQWLHKTPKKVFYWLHLYLHMNLSTVINNKRVKIRKSSLLHNMLLRGNS